MESEKKEDRVLRYFICMDCKKSFSKKIPANVDIGKANMPYGVYFHYREGGWCEYYDLDGNKHSQAVYLTCPRCGSKHIDLSKKALKKAIKRIMEDVEADKLTEVAIEMVKEMNKKGGCEACMRQVIKALSIIKDSHNADACSRDKAYRCYQFHNKRLEKKIRALL